MKFSFHDMCFGIFSKDPRARPGWMTRDQGSSTVLSSLWDFSRVVMHCLLADEMLFYRIYPVVSMNGRVFLDRDVTIGGYKFPKNVGLPFPGSRCHCMVFAVSGF